MSDMSDAWQAKVEKAFVDGAKWAEQFLVWNDPTSSRQLYEAAEKAAKLRWPKDDE